MDPRAWSRFGYVYGNPASFTAPTGHCVFGIDTAVCIGIAIGAVTGALIAGGAEYGTQALETYVETDDLSEALSLQNKNWKRVLVGSIIGGVAGGVTGGVGAIAGGGVRGFLIRTTSSALVNASANASYVGAQAYFVEGATLETASTLSAQHLITQGRRDLIIGATASIFADVLSLGANSLLGMAFDPNPYYLPSPDYRISGSLAGRPTSSAAGSRGLRIFAETPAWHPALRASTLVGPEAFSNTGLLTVMYDHFSYR